MSITDPPLRFAVIGARRGRTFIHSARSLRDRQVELTAVCDTSPAMLEEWKDEPEITLHSDYEAVLNDPKIDAVCLATPVPLHARQAIAALRAGKHVLSEVTAAYTLEEGWELIEAVRKSGRTYMMAENYCFMEPVLQVQRMVEEGVFGELIYASGSYVHDCRKLFFTAEGDLTWRGELRRNLLANSYPTHSLGPVARWLGINRTDFLETTASWASRTAAVPHYARRQHPDRPEYGETKFWAHADTVSTQIKTRKGALIDLRVDWCSARPHQMTRYELQGTRASFCWPDGPGKPEPLVWIEGKSPADEYGIATGWEPLLRYREAFEHPLWREFRAGAATAGHGGGDYFVLREFVGAIREGRPPLIDVVDAVTWSSITPLSQASIAQGSAPVAVPDFTLPRA
ncbi:MAG TPA: Gfo/Idh/MocA family oxidoreductase [Chthoniobacteraceae bacterium]|nr:Gfo/Idh/MocA family oxidoreductase [Chthoniobacteraceae bacterium]